jgi:hypothetical protein
MMLQYDDTADNLEPELEKANPDITQPASDPDNNVNDHHLSLNAMKGTNWTH